MTRLPSWGSYLSPIDGPRAVATSLLRQLWQKLGHLTVPDQASVAALRAVPTIALEDRGSICSDLVYVLDTYRTFRWDRQSVAVDDGRLVVRPDDVPVSLGGRWLAADFKDWRGPFYCHAFQHAQYVADTIPLSAPDHMPSLLSLSAGKSPSIFVCYTGKSPVLHDQEPGTLFNERYRYRLKVISANWRGEPAARFGSPVADEFANDPGAEEMMGRVEWFIRKNSDGLQRTMGVGTIAMGESRPVESWGADRRLMYVLDITVQVTTEVYNEAEELHQLVGAKVQFQQTPPTPAADIAPPSIVRFDT